jgi:hypothetical protein
MKKCQVVLSLLAAGLSCALKAAEPSTTPILRIEAEMHSAQLWRVASDSSGRLVLTGSNDKTARLWELPEGRLLRVLRPPIAEGNPGKIYACALSPDGSLAAIGGWTTLDPTGATDCAIYFFDTATGRMVRRIGGLPNVVLDLAFSAQGRRIAATGDYGLRVWEVDTGKEIGRDGDYAKRSNNADWFGEDKLVTPSMDGNVRLYRVIEGPEGGKLSLVKKTAVKGGTSPYSARFTPDGKRIAVGFDGIPPMVTVIDGNDLSFAFTPNLSGIDNGELSSVTWTADGSALAAGGTWANNGRPIRRWGNAGKGAARDVLGSLSAIMDLRPLPEGRILFGGAEPTWGVITANGQRQVLGTSPLADYRDDESMSHFRVSSDGMMVGFGYDVFGQSPASFSIGDRRLELLKEAKAPAGLRAPRLQGLSVTDWMHSASPKLAGKPLALDNYETSRCLAITREGTSFLLGADYQMRRFSAKGELTWSMPVASTTWAVNLADNDRLAVAAIGDGTIRWFRYDTGKELLAFFPHADRKRWVLWTPQGFYDCSPGAESLIGWHVNRAKDEAGDFFPAAKFRAQFYRPDVIQQVLTKGDVIVALKSADETAGRKAQPAVAVEALVSKMAPPVVELAVGGALGEETIPANAKSFTVRYRVRRSGGEAVTRVRLLVDGRPISTDAPVPANDNAEARVEAPVPAERDCVLTVLAEHRYAVSEPATLRLVRAGATPSGPKIEDVPAALKPKLYLLAAGISDYLRNDQLEDLHFAAKDAQDLAGAFRRQEGGLYQKVEAKVLGDKEATAANILDGLDWIKAQTTAKDVAVIFLSGHGENDEQLRYYFCPHDYDKSRRLRTGVSFEDIQKTVQGLAGKVLFFIDSCHAGNALGKLYAAKSAGAQVDVTRLVNELSGAENGAIVFTSSTGRQLSLELVTQNNGAFTKAIVEGLDGKADLLRNGKITVSSLETFVAERVKELTDGQQTPTVAKPQTVPDFPIAVKR